MLSVAAVIRALRVMKQLQTVNDIMSKNTVKTLNIGTPRLNTVAVLNIKQFNFTMK